MNLPTIILVRHGQTEWNVEGRYQGQLNSNLTPLGKTQAKNNALKIKKSITTINNIKIYASPLGRAKESAYIIADNLNINRETIIFEERLKEFHYGIFEGKTKLFCKEHYAKEFKEREANKWSYIIEGGESYEIVTQRLESWLKTLKSDEPIIIVAHEMINRALRGIYCGLEQESMLILHQKNDVVLKLGKSQEIVVK